jgi:DnaJ-class molecular chaperone
MNRNFPTEFKKHLTTPGIKGAFVSMIEGRHPRDCKNCGGIGTIILFIATNGPFNNVPSGVAHFADDKWWSGKNFEEACPNCKGTGIDPNYAERTVKIREIRLEGVVK